MGIAQNKQRNRPAGKRLPEGAREKAVVEAAADFFAEHGFSGSTRALARQLGVTQALLYRYFPSKGALIERVFESVFLERWDPGWTGLLTDRSRPLQHRISAFYQAYASRTTRRSTTFRPGCSG
ncbi:MAG TPA: TetR/AcrR family transcriptional regulator [Alphaproteobacteria bacterium]|nr:TetR/AcrR family transcriptional regulator [Alphaproteobacteria bacterium]